MVSFSLAWEKRRIEISRKKSRVKRMLDCIASFRSGTELVKWELPSNFAQVKSNQTWRCQMSLRVSEADGAKLLRSIGCVNEKALKDHRRIQDRLNSIVAVVGTADYQEPTDPEDQQLLKSISDTLAAEGEGSIEVVPTNGSNGESEHKTKKNGNGKKPVKKDNKKLSCIAAAVKVLKEARKPLSTKEMIEKMEAKGYWTSPGGSTTPHNSLYAAIITEIAKKGNESRFEKTDKGRFGLKQQAS